MSELRSRPVDGTSVTVERLDHIHTHDIEESFRTKKPSILLGYIKSEACKFYRQYLLPCRHIFHCDTEVKLLTAVQWEVYLMIFAECGMEVYETARTVWVEEECPVDGISRGQTLSVVCGKASSKYNSSSMLHMS